MKIIRYFLIAVIFLLQNIFSLQAQNTEGTDFWLTFGRNRNTLYNNSNLDLQIRIIGGKNLTKGAIYFTNLNDFVDFSIPAHQIFNHTLSLSQKQAVYNETMGVSNRSIRISTDQPVSVYALNQAPVTADATNIFPVTSLGNEYYQMSYTPDPSVLFDAYAVVATEDNTKVYHANAPIPVATLNTGGVYYRTSAGDMTGTHITADKPVAFFALCQNAQIPTTHGTSDHLMQQLSPINTWGKKFFVPVSHLTKDIVRIMASQDGTHITQTGGVLLSPLPPGGQPSLDNLQAGQFVDLIVYLDSAGCYIQSDKPIGVCTYLTGCFYNSTISSDPAQCWLPSTTQMVTNTLIAPFTPNPPTNINAHFALVITPTGTRKNTVVSIGGALSVTLNDDSWKDNIVAGMSFYNMPLTNTTESYSFTNKSGLIVLCYGIGSQESYYYLGGSAMRDLDVAFYANDIHFQNLKDTTFCNKNVFFRAEIEGFNPTTDTLKWYVNGIEEETAKNRITWDKTFDTGNYEIKMVVTYGNGESKTVVAILRIRALWIKIQNVRY